MFKLITVVALLITSLSAPPAHAGFWSSVSNFFGFSGRSSTSRDHGETLVQVRRRDPKTGKVRTFYVPQSSKLVPSNYYNGFYDHGLDGGVRTVSRGVAGRTMSDGSCYGSGCN